MKFDSDKLLRVITIVSAATGLYIAIFGDADKIMEDKIEEKFKELSEKENVGV